MKEFIAQYIRELEEILDSVQIDKLENIVELIYDAYKKNKQVFIFGNGGSASTASHFACDLSKGTILEGKPRLKAMSLNDNMALITAISNDLDYTEVFREQLKNMINEGDVVMGITASGNSDNILKAMEYARKHSANTVGIIGFGGGKLKDVVDKHIIISNNDYGQVEGFHVVLAHLISLCFKEKIKNE